MADTEFISIGQPSKGRFPKKDVESISMLSGGNHPELAQDICNHLNITGCNTILRQFMNGETQVSIVDSVRDKDVFIVQPTATNPNNSLMELLILIDAARRASAKRITAVIPCFGYARQDKKEASRAPITAKLVANLIERAGADRILTLDLHSSQLEGFFNIPVDNLAAEPFFYAEINEIKGDKIIVAPGVGGVHRAKKLSDDLDIPLAIIHFGTIQPGLTKSSVADEADVMKVVGDVKGKIAVMIEDLADTCEMECKMADALIKAGATEVYMAVTHAILSGNALKNLEESPIRQVLMTNSIPRSSQETNHPKISIVDSAPYFAKAVHLVHLGDVAIANRRELRSFGPSLSMLHLPTSPMQSPQLTSHTHPEWKIQHLKL
eukprot:TRINITY_DN10672_c0_g1_i1.p1 TRINITY_DN10672_c0_g1~~TRINITY_DN10672_c0_g1_i1.p1  ORF type:complete len:380 (+),score=105.28 TRINITY_DN10672_c0_g1_i1:87-1226(+)